MNVLVISTHPDDEVLGCGGLIARHSSMGDEVRVLIVTRGSEDLFDPRVIETTRGELKKAHQILGVSKAEFLDFPAPKLDGVPGHLLADALSKSIADFQPDLLLLPHFGDLHADHRLVFHATLVAARPIREQNIGRIMCYETLSETEWAPPGASEAFIPDVFVDISEFLDLKLQAMSCYQTQLKEFPHSRSIKALEALARYRGATVHLHAAEAFSIVREIIA